MIIGVSRQYSTTKFLKTELSKYDGNKLLLVEENHDFQVDENEHEYQVVYVSAMTINDNKSFPKRLIRRTGVQKLPCMFWLSDDGEIQYELKTNANTK